MLPHSETKLRHAKQPLSGDCADKKSRFTEMADAQDEVVKVLGEAVYQVLAEGRELSNDSVREMALLLSEVDDDMSVESAVGELRL